MSVATAFPVSQSLDTMDLTSINTIRTLAMDGVQAANSGHPGAPMAMAPVAYCLWQKFLRFDPQDRVWPNRDRFVPSMGARVHAALFVEVEQLFEAWEIVACCQPLPCTRHPYAGGDALAQRTRSCLHA